MICLIASVVYSLLSFTAGYVAELASIGGSTTMLIQFLMLIVGFMVLSAFVQTLLPTNFHRGIAVSGIFLVICVLMGFFFIALVFAMTTLRSTYNYF